jgi:hypothetical protein
MSLCTEAGPNCVSQEVVGRPSQIGDVSYKLRLDPDGSLSLRALAAKLTAEGLPTPAGAVVWTAATVARVKARPARRRVGGSLLPATAQGPPMGRCGPWQAIASPPRCRIPQSPLPRP